MIITTEIVTGFHTDIINKSGGAHGIHDANLLDSAVNNIYATFDKIDLYPTIIEKATRLSFSLNMNHPFVDGNKRIAMHMLAVLLRFNGVNYLPTNKDVIRVGLSVADGNMSFPQLFAWVLTVI